MDSFPLIKLCFTQLLQFGWNSKLPLSWSSHDASPAEWQSLSFPLSPCLKWWQKKFLLALFYSINSVTDFSSLGQNCSKDVVKEVPSCSGNNLERLELLWGVNQGARTCLEIYHLRKHLKRRSSCSSASLTAMLLLSISPQKAQCFTGNVMSSCLPVIYLSVFFYLCFQSPLLSCLSHSSHP